MPKDIEAIPKAYRRKVIAQNRIVKPSKMREKNKSSLISAIKQELPHTSMNTHPKLNNKPTIYLSTNDGC